MDSLPSSKQKKEESAQGISININSPSNKITVVSQDYIEVVVHVDGKGGGGDRSALKEEASEISRAVLTAVKSARGAAA